MATLEDGGGLVLKLTPAEPLALSGGTRCCTLVLRNQSGRSIWVNRRMAINHPSSPPHLREVDFLIQDADGRLAESLAKVRVGLPQPGDYMALAPGQAIERPVDLTLWYTLGPDREYEVQAVYENYFVPGTLKGMPIWTGRTASRALRMTPGVEAPVLA